MTSPSDSKANGAAASYSKDKLPYGSVESAGKQQSLSRFAVYGTLRDDDDTKKPWTAKFVAGASAETGTVKRVAMFRKGRLGWPYALLTNDEK